MEKADCSPQCGWALSNPVEGLNRPKVDIHQEEGMPVAQLPWTRKISLFFFFNHGCWMGASAAWVSGYLALSTGFPGSPACRLQTLGLVSLHNPRNKSCIINPSLSLYTDSIGSISLENLIHMYWFLNLFLFLHRLLLRFGFLFMSLLPWPLQ